MKPISNLWRHTRVFFSLFLFTAYQLASSLGALNGDMPVNRGYTRGTDGPSWGATGPSASDLARQQFERQRAAQELRFQQRQQFLQSFSQSLATAFQSTESTPDIDSADTDNDVASPSEFQPSPPPPQPANEFPVQTAPARPTFSEPLSSFFDNSATSNPIDYSISPDLDRFVREDMDRQHAYFDQIARQKEQNASTWLNADVSTDSQGNYDTLLRDIGRQSSSAISSGISMAFDRFKPEMLADVVKSAEGTKYEVVTYGIKGTDPTLYPIEPFARNLEPVGAVRKAIRRKLMGDLAQRPPEDTQGAVPFLDSWMDYGEEATEAGIKGWTWSTPKKLYFDLGGKIREKWKAMLDQNIDEGKFKDL